MFTRYSRLSIRLYNRFDNRLYRVNGVLRNRVDAKHACSLGHVINMADTDSGGNPSRFMAFSGRQRRNDRPGKSQIAGFRLSRPPRLASVRRAVSSETRRTASRRAAPCTPCLQHVDETRKSLREIARRSPSRRTVQLHPNVRLQRGP